MKAKEIKISGHILERNLLGILFGALRDKEVDITDIEISAATLKGGWDEKCPSIMVFKIIAYEDRDFEKAYEEVLQLIKENGCRIIYSKELD
jgi:chromatin segregation and condensation protein Rec8/ScpA/Scc1 (kleisin family)